MIDKDLKNDIAQSLRQNSSVIVVYVLGSFVQGEAGEESDFDLSVVVDKKQPESLDTIYEMLKKIQFPKNLDLSVIDRASSPLFLYQIISKGERLYERSRNDVVEFEAFVMHNYYDTAHMRTIYTENLKKKFAQTPYAN